jgi:hypothetical protein
MPPTELYFDALCAYHELAEDLQEVLEVRQRELVTVRGWGRLAFECRAWIRIGRLLARLDRPFDEALAQARSLAARLRKPAPYLEQLERIERGETEPDPAAAHI